MSLNDLDSRVHETNAGFWAAIDGDNTLRLDYDLAATSIVFDLGGYRGEWSEQIHRRYGCRIFVFEPAPSFASQITDRFRSQSDISVFGFALGASDGTLQLSLNENATSSYTSGTGDFVEAEVRDFIAFLDDQQIEGIDLLKINIEGGEYELLDHLISTGCISRVRHIQVQFHSFVPGAEERVEDIRRRLWETHVPVYSLDWIWESWTRTTDTAERMKALDGGFRWQIQALRGMSSFASRYISRNRDLEMLIGRLAEDSRILNNWRRRLNVVLRIRNLFRR